MNRSGMVEISISDFCMSFVRCLESDGIGGNLFEMCNFFFVSILFVTFTSVQNHKVSQLNPVYGKMGKHVW